MWNPTRTPTFSPRSEPGAGQGNCTKEVIQDITGREEEGNQHHHPRSEASSLLGNQTASPSVLAAGPSGNKPVPTPACALASMRTKARQPG